MNSKSPYFSSLILLSALGLIVFGFFRIKEHTEGRLKKQVGQMLIVGFRGTGADEASFILKAIKDLNLGGVVLFDIDGSTKGFPRNITGAEQVKGLIKNLKKSSLTPLMVAVDAEGGSVNRLKPKYGFIPVPGHRELGEKNDLNETRNASAKLARELSELGFNVNFAPAVDVDVNPENPVIGAMGRSFSADEKIVSEQAKAFIEGQHEYGIVTAIKHFPGHGSSKTDSHKGLADVSETYRDKELVPYKELIKGGFLDMVMTAHIMNRKIDSEYPATLSAHYINEILRNMIGFEGVVISDDMQMGAITKYYGFKEALIRAVNAGCDLLIISNNGSVYDETAPYRARDIIFDAVKNGEIPLKRIAESSRRIEDLKKRFKKDSVAGNKLK
ncbi:MAG: glycoside hydrolase family 3 protein [Candidatus Omnitrophica bacterium]|nr:glycoside hydrolase family 3 protein [Candidatus Omnitrophota bacterium]